MTRRGWALLAWAAILAIFIGVAAADGGRNCQVPSSGLFHRLLGNSKFVDTHSRSWRFSPCRQVK